MSAFLHSYNCFVMNQCIYFILSVLGQMLISAEISRS